MKHTALIFFLVFFLSVLLTPAHATAVTFPSCPNPGGNLVASYPDGWHWIVAHSQLQWGSDTVYSIGNGNYVQCFCAKTPLQTTPNQIGGGTQTNWWKASSLTQEQINQLLSQGWTLVSNGADFGLENAPYLAKNSPYSCGGSNCCGTCGGTRIQKNTLSLTQQITVETNTGGNTIKKNTGGSSNISTGDTHSSILTVVSGGTNVLQQSSCSSCTPNGIDISIIGNGRNSQNSVSVSQQN